VKKKVLIIEFYRSHFELLYSHQVIWEAIGYDVQFFLNEKLKEKTPELPPEKCTYFSDKTYFYLLQILHQILKQGFKIVVCNTAHGIRARNFVVLAKTVPYLRVLGVCHYADTLQESLTQKIISWGIEKYWVLSEMFFENGILQNRKRIDVLYPVFRSIKPPATHASSISSDKLRIAIIGEISPNKKDFATLINHLVNYKSALENKIIFVCLGNANTQYGRLVKEEISLKQLSDFFIFYDRFIPDTELLSILTSCHLIATLIHPNVTPIFQEYLYSNISGSYNLAYWGSIPLLLDSSFASFSDFKEISYFYTPSDLGQKLVFLCQNPDTITILQKNFELFNSKLSVAYQAARVKNFLNI